MAVAFGDFVFDPVRRELRKSGSPLKVDPKQLDLLACFLTHPGRLLSKQELLDEVWEGRALGDSVLSVAVAKLRKVLGEVSSERGLIENRYGRGYRFLGAISQVTQTEAAEVSSPGLPAIGSASTLLVGRDESRQRLAAALDRARSGHGGFVTLIGESGIGKTRLAEDLGSFAERSGVRSAWGRFQRDEAAPPLWAFAQVLRELDSGELAAELLVDRAGSCSTRENGRGIMLDAVDTSHRAIDQAAQALTKLARQQPLLILLDDLQWADAASLRLLSYLTSDIARAPMLIVATQRSGEPTGDERRASDLTRLLTHRHCERIELQRLRESDIAAYLEGMFGAGGAALCRTVFARSEGNPFFMVDLLRPWTFSGAGLPEAEQLALSEFVRDPVRQRVSTLSELSRSVLAAASVIGHDFDLALLSHLTQRGAGELLEALDGSLANDTVVPSNEVLGGYAFDHELIREVLYEGLSAAERCRLHLRAAEGLLRRKEAGQTVSSAELARHFLAALPQGDTSQAVEHARAAAAAASRMGSHADARVFLRRALEALRFDIVASVETRTLVLLELAMVERIQGDGNYRVHLAQGIALARKHSLGALLTIAGRLLSPAPGILAQPDASDVLEAALEVLPANDTKRRAIALAHLAWTPPHCRSARRVNELLEQAEQLAHESEDLIARATVRTARLFFTGGPATQARAEALATEIDRDIREHSELSGHARRIPTHTFRLITATQRGDLPAAQRAETARRLELAQLNNVELEWHEQRYRVVQRMNRGDFAGVDDELQALRARAKQLGLQAWPTLWALDYGTLLLWTTGLGEFSQRLRTGFAPHGSDSPQTRAHKLRGMVDNGFIEDARDALSNVTLEALADIPTDRDYLVVLTHYAVASAASKSLPHCAALYDLLSPFPEYYAMGISFHAYGSVSHTLGLLSRALGHKERARDHFELGLHKHASFGLKAWETRSAVALAEQLRELGDTKRVPELLDHAARIASEAGLGPLLEQIRRVGSVTVS